MSWRVFSQLVRISFHLDTAYRSGFWFAVFGRTLGIVTFLATYGVIFSSVERLAGLTADQALLYFATFTLVQQLLQALFIRGFNRMPTQIHRGQLDQMLLRPIDAQLYMSLQLTSFLSIFNILPALGLLGWAFWRSPEVFTWWYIPLVGLAILGTYAVWFLFMCLAFIATQFSALSEVFSSFFIMLQFPVQVYRGPVAFLLTFVVPLATMILLPVRVLFEPGMGPQLAAGGTILVAGLLVLTRLAWNAGLRHYASAN